MIGVWSSSEARHSCVATSGCQATILHLILKKGVYASFVTWKHKFLQGFLFYSRLLEAKNLDSFKLKLISGKINILIFEKNKDDNVNNKTDAN